MTRTQSNSQKSIYHICRDFGRDEKWLDKYIRKFDMPLGDFTDHLKVLAYGLAKEGESRETIISTLLANNPFAKVIVKDIEAMIEKAQGGR